MPNESRLLRYLPPVAYAEPSDGAKPSLNDLLLIFEKLLIGIEDGFRVEHKTSDETSPHHHQGLQTVISRIPELFSPWKTPAELLPMLASWLALELPDFWDEYQQRKIISEIAEIYRLRGTKAGLQRYLELHVVGKSRPRIVIDDGSRILWIRPEPGVLTPISTLVSQGGQVEGDTVVQDGLVRPSCIGATPDGHLFVGDLGMDPVKPGLWRISVDDHRQSLLSTTPTRIGKTDRSPDTTHIAAITVVTGKSGAHNVYVLGGGALFQVADPDGVAPTLKHLTDVKMTMPIGMVPGPDEGEFWVLDRGAELGKKAEPKLLIVQISDKLETRSEDIVGVQEPLCVAVRVVDNKRTLVIGDSGTRGKFSANIVECHKEDERWKGMPLLAEENTGAGPNPLVAPVGLVCLSDETIYVLDAGLKPFAPDRNYSYFADTARRPSVFRLELREKMVVPATTETELVYPTGIAQLGDKFYICDPGPPPTEQDATVGSWRMHSHSFAVLVHFGGKDLTKEKLRLEPEEKETLSNIVQILESEKPAHTLGQVKSTTTIIEE